MPHPFLQLLQEASKKNHTVPEWLHEEWIKVTGPAMSNQPVIKALMELVRIENEEDHASWLKKWYAEDDTFIAAILAKTLHCLGPMALIRDKETEGKVSGVILQQFGIMFAFGYVVAKMKYEDPLPPSVKTKEE